jgi:hypothetical protein
MTLDRPQRTLETSSSGTQTIANVLRMRNIQPEVTRARYSHPALPGLAWSIVDTGTEGACWQTAGENVIHILHAQDEVTCRVTVDGESMPILPGDSIAIGAKASVRLSPAILAFHISASRGRQLDPRSPSHGTEHFSGFNRQTAYPTDREIALERWKLTGPQRISTDNRKALAIMVLYGNVSFIQCGSIETLDAGESIVAHGKGNDFEVVPDGLAYIAIATPGST